MNLFRRPKYNPQPNKSNFNVSEIIEICIDQLSHLVHSKNIIVDYKIDPSLQVYAEPSSIQIILRNLISNAIKYSYEGGNIKIEAVEQIKDITINVIDNGIGIDSKKVKDILIEYQSKKGTKGEEGLGLGLKLSRDLALANDGRLSIKSTPHKNTVVTLSLPKATIQKHTQLKDHVAAMDRI